MVKFNANINFLQNSGIISGTSGVFFDDIHLTDPIGISEPGQNELLPKFTSISIVGAINELCSIGQTSVNGLSGSISITSPDNSILIGDNEQSVELSGLFTTTSGAILEQKCSDIDILSGLINQTGISSQTSINGLSGSLSITSSNSGAINIIQDGQNLILSGLYTPTSGALIDQKCAEINTLSGLILPDSGQTSINGLSGVVTVVSPNNTVFITPNGQNLELDSIFTWTSGQLLESLALSSGVESLNGLSGVVDIVPGNNGITTSVNGQTIELSSLFTYTSGQIIDQKCEDLNIISGLVNNSPSKIPINFTPISGIEFVLEHGLNTEEFTFTMWNTGHTPRRFVLPENVYSSGLNHAVVELHTPMSGLVVFVG